jgi:GDPmannose 4,6-dehydratase
MWLMLQADEPDDFVIATGTSYSVKDFVLEALKAAELPGDLDDYLEYDKSMERPSEVDTLIGDATKAKKVLGWSPTVSFKELVHLMVKNDLELESKK